MVISEKHLYCLHHITGKFVIEMYVTTALLLLPHHQRLMFVKQGNRYEMYKSDKTNKSVT